MYVTEIVRLFVVSHIILDADIKSVVEGMTERIIAIINLRGVLVELNHILYDLVSVTQSEMFKSILGVSDSVTIYSFSLPKCLLSYLWCLSYLI